MTSPILDAMPGVHSTIIGIVGATYTFFALPMYERLRESRERLEVLVRRSVEAGSPGNRLAGPPEGLIQADGTLNQELVREILNTAGTAHLTPPHQFGNLGEELVSQHEDELIDLVHRTAAVLYTILTAYPFSGRPIVTVVGETEQLEAKKTGDGMSLRRTQDLERDLGFLAWWTKNYKERLLALFEHVDRLIAKRQLRDLKESFTAVARDWELVETPEQAKKRWDEHWAHFITKPYCRPTIEDFLQKIEALSRDVLPHLVNAVKKHEENRAGFALRIRSLLVVGLVVFELLIGIAIPPVLQTIREPLKLTWPLWAEGAYFLISLLPYFLLLAFCWRFVWRERTL